MSTPQPITDEHRATFDAMTAAMERWHGDPDAIRTACLLLIADSEARAVEAVASTRDTYQRDAYYLRKDLCEIAAAFNVGVPDGEEAKKRIIAVKAERDQLRAEVRKLQEQIGQQLAACDCAAIMDTPEMHEKNKTVTRENPFWSNAFESVMRRTAECIALRAEVERLKKPTSEIEGDSPENTETNPKSWVAWKARAERAEAELAKERARLRYLSELWSPTSSPNDSIAKWLVVGDHNGFIRAIDAATKEHGT